MGKNNTDLFMFIISIKQNIMIMFIYVLKGLSDVWSWKPHLFGGMSVENNSISVSAKSTAFIPLIHSRLSQYTQLTCVTHLFLKFEVDIVELRSSQVKLLTKRGSCWLQRWSDRESEPKRKATVDVSTVGLWRPTPV